MSIKEIIHPLVCHSHVFLPFVWVCLILTEASSQMVNHEGPVCSSSKYAVTAYFDRARQKWKWNPGVATLDSKWSASYFFIFSEWLRAIGRVQRAPTYVVWNHFVLKKHTRDGFQLPGWLRHGGCFGRVSTSPTVTWKTTPHQHAYFFCVYFVPFAAYFSGVRCKRTHLLPAWHCVLWRCAVRSADEQTGPK